MRGYEHPDKAQVPDHRRAPTRPAPASLADEFLALQRTVGNAATARLVEDAEDTLVHQVLRSTGRPLGAPARQEMEARLGADFSDVRVHDDAAARASAEEVGARAYTSGHHVVLGAGGVDRHTLAHELTHVIQQRSGPVSGTGTGTGLAVSHPTDRFEREAEANATRAMAAGPVQRMPAAAPHPPAATTAAGSVLPIQLLTSAAPRTGAVPIAEGQVATVPAGGQIHYPGLNSCMTVTVHLRNGSMVGGHMVIRHEGGQNSSDQVMQDIRQRVGNGPVAAIELVGDFQSWNSLWLSQNTVDIYAALSTQGPIRDDEPTLNAEPGARAALVTAAQRILGHGADKYDTEQFDGGSWHVDSMPASRRTGIRGLLPRMWDAVRGR